MSQNWLGLSINKGLPAKGLLMTHEMHGGDDDEAHAVLTITLGERDRRAAVRLLSLLFGMDEGRGKELTTLALANVDTAESRDRSILVERARQTFVDRARRSRIFHPAMFGEPAWDMMLALYVTEQSQARLTVSGLVNLSGVPPTTALRWLEFLEKEELVARRSSPVDRRVFYIELTDQARDALDAFFSGAVTAEKVTG